MAVPALHSASRPNRKGRDRRVRRQHGFSLVELIAAVAILVAVIAFGALNVRPLDNSLQGGTALLISALQEARTEALSSTSAVRVGLTPTSLTFTRATDCDPLTPNGGAARTGPPLLPVGARLTGDVSPFNLCFSARGEASRVATITYQNRQGKQMAIKVYLAGGVSAQ